MKNGFSVRLLFCPLVAGLALASTGAPAHAQGARADRPYRGLFGSGPSDLEQRLSVSGSVGGGWDTNLIADSRNQQGARVSDLNSQHRGGVGTASGSIAYLLARQRWGANVSAGTSARYYPSLSTKIVRREYASGGVNASIGKGLSASARASYQPYSLLSMFPVVSFDPTNGTEVIDEDFASSSEHYASYAGSLNYDHPLSPRTSFGLDTSYRIRESSASANHFSSWSAGGRLTHQVTRDLGLRVGYRLIEGRYTNAGGTQRPLNHVIDAGLDYNHALSISRRTTVSFSTGTSAVSRQFDRTRYRFVGRASLSHEIGRTWFTSASYNRGLFFIDDWPEPIFSDAITVGLSGLISRRVQFQSSVRAATGARGFARENTGGFNAYSARVGLSYAVNRFINSGVSYTYYNHKFADSGLLAPGFPGHVDRESVRVFVTFWAPLFERSRRQ